MPENLPIRDIFPIAEKPCTGSIPVVENTTRTSTGSLFGDTATYNCDVGHRFPDNTTTAMISCNSSALWDVPPSACQSNVYLYY